MIFTEAIQKLRHINQPKQIEFLELVTSTLEKSRVVSHLLVRGSIGTGKVDRSSDVDLVIGVQPEALEDFLCILDSIIRIELGSLFPGWYDILAPNLNGWGFVYLVPFKGVLYELDLYVVSKDTIPSIINIGALQIYSKTETIQDRNHLKRQKNNNNYIENIDINKFIKNDPTQNLIIETFSLLHMMSKRITRQQWFIVYGLSYLVNDAMRRLIKNCLLPNSKHWGWYYLEDELGIDPRGVKCLQELSALISIPPTPNHLNVSTVFNHIIRIISIANPELSTEFKLKIEAYHYYMKIK